MSPMFYKCAVALLFLVFSNGGHCLAPQLSHTSVVRHLSRATDVTRGSFVVAHAITDENPGYDTENAAVDALGPINLKDKKGAANESGAVDTPVTPAAEGKPVASEAVVKMQEKSIRSKLDVVLIGPKFILKFITVILIKVLVDAVVYPTLWFYRLWKKLILKVLGASKNEKTS
eukprot:CAMPEP_0194268636 /NCGR_PEP_ID=MMETSP0169-20130528/2923_1 /TAXON_ID=218684 /ORGANISM="Corethron pennatum, Strain L29A3" /LENGTH=173 /DNA_ID=CAMNT_0039009933 /DNA_START=118 /DNA_END=639 /DNA_ORIENTATION=-